jgi:hypothetical protein
MVSKMITFDDDADFQAVQALPCFCPTRMVDGQPKKVKVSKPVSSKGNGVLEKLYLDVGGCPKFTINLAIRELMQNLVDAAVDMNGDTHQGLQISRGTLIAKTKDGPDVLYNATTIHNGQVRFAEFQQSQSKLFFINFGNLLPNKAALLTFGRSSKAAKVSQAGKHGEGMKIAFMRFLQQDAKIELFACIPSEDGLVNEYNRFKIVLIEHGPDSGIITYKHTKRVPNSRPGAPLHFMLSIGTTAIKHRVDIFDAILVPNRELFTPITPEDPGNLITASKYLRYVYVKHIFVAQYMVPWMMFGYDVFHIEVNRAREDLNWQDLIVCVAKIWDKNMPEHGRLFYDNFISNKSTAPDGLIEVRAIHHLSVASRQILSNFLRDGDDKLWLITQADVPIFKRCFSARHLVLNRNAEGLISKSLTQMISEHQNHLQNADCVEPAMEATLNACFKPLKIQLCNVKDCDLRLIHNPLLTEVKINLATFVEPKIRIVAWYIFTHVIQSIQSYTPYGFLDTIFPEVAPDSAAVATASEEAADENPPEQSVAEFEVANDKKRPPFEVPADYDCSLEWVVKKRKQDPQ